VDNTISTDVKRGAKPTIKPILAFAGLAALVAPNIALASALGYSTPVPAWLALSLVSFLFLMATWTYVHVAK